MKATDLEKFADAWAGAWEMYGRRVSAGAIELAGRALMRFDLDDITRALTVHINDPDTGQYPPKPADIVRIMEGTKDDRASRAWTKLYDALRKVGTHADVVFDDPIIHAVVQDMGGWIQFGSMLTEEEPFRAREFTKRYAGYMGRESVAYPRLLIGRTTASNKSSGHENGKHDRPVLIGDPEIAARVLERGSDNPGTPMITAPQTLIEPLRELTSDQEPKEEAA